MSGVVIWDRLTGQEVQDIRGWQPLGRYIFVAGSRAIALNGRPAQKGQYLAASAAGWSLRDERLPIRLDGDFGRTPLPADVTVDAITAIAADVVGAMAIGSLDMVAEIPPILQDVDKRLAEQHLELEIGSDGRYLRAVCHDPVARLRPVHRLMPVSRSRRITPQTIVRLAAHSEDWARLRPDGVRPEKVLTPQREVDIDLYENRVTARLVEHLYHYIGRRLAEVTDIEVMYDDVRRLFDDAANRSWRSQGHLYKLLEALMEKEELRRAQVAERLKELRSLRASLASLLGSPIRSGVNRQAEVPSMLRVTNLFEDDERYRGVASLWRAWIVADAGIRSADQHFRYVQDWCGGFDAYTALLLIRAFDQLGLRPADDNAVPGPGDAEIVVYPYDETEVALRWEASRTFTVIRPDTGRVLLRVVSLPHALTREGSGKAVLGKLQALKESGVGAEAPTIVVYPGSREERAKLPTHVRLRAYEGPELCAPGSGGKIFPIPVSPLELDSVGRIARSLRWAIEDDRLGLYPVHVRCDRTEAAMIAAAAPWTQQVPHGVEVVVPPSPQEIAKARSLIVETRVDRAHLARVAFTAERLRRLWAELEEAARWTATLTRCPICAKPAPDPARAFHRRDDGTFRCACECKSVWETRRCHSCKKTYGVILLRTPGSAVTYHADGPPSSPELGGDGDFLDRLYGADLLAAPCWIRERVFICPHCGTCGEVSPTMQTSCGRCG
ncbi:hypothetical protein ABZ912_48135 [Nonomuraea angiospora]|uniref:hypothetical protein n=1 Tax=Nonomuraea angiospora TaxID=46172 RepID=UPI003408E2AA